MKSRDLAILAIAKLAEEQQRQQNKENAALLAMRRKAIEQRQHSVPAKKKTKLPLKLQNTFEKNLAGVPGGGLRGFYQIMKMIEAEETGCRIATEAEELNLLNSAQNCYTTKGNYIV